jgi:hypothetical protein
LETIGQREAHVDGGRNRGSLWTFVDQKWRDALNIAAAEQTGWGLGGSWSRPLRIDKKGHSGRAEAKKLATAAILVTTTESKPADLGSNPRRCKFADVLVCPGQHAPWRCGAFGSIGPEERARIIEDNKLCSFCLLYDRAEACRIKANKSKPACNLPECGDGHMLWLHELLKGTAGSEGKVHVVQASEGWRTPEEGWMDNGGEEGEEIMFVNVVQGEASDSNKDKPGIEVDVEREAAASDKSVRCREFR